MVKKLLVRFDVNRAEPFNGDLLVPSDEEGHMVWRGIKSGMLADYGLMVYVGAEVGVNELFAKLVDAGVHVASVEIMRSRLNSYIDRCKELRIGNVVETTPTKTVDTGDITLKVIAKSIAHHCFCRTSPSVASGASLRGGKWSW